MQAETLESKKEELKINKRDNFQKYLMLSALKYGWLFMKKHHYYFCFKKMDKKTANLVMSHGTFLQITSAAASKPINQKSH